MADNGAGGPFLAPLEPIGSGTLLLTMVTKATRKVISAKGRGKRQRGQSHHRQRVESDIDDDMEGCQDEDDPTDVLSGGKSASKTFISDLVLLPSVTTSVVPSGKAVGQSGLQQNPAQPPAAA
jgi:hypothetical protein